MVGQRVGEFLQRRSRVLEIVFFISVAVVLVAIRIVEYRVVSSGEAHWEEIQSDLCTHALSAASEEFTGQQRLARRVATDFGAYPAVVAFLAGRSQDLASVFAQAAKVSADQGMGIELYDHDSRIVAWAGRSGPSQQREIRIALDGQMTSYVSRSPIFSQLFVANPVRDEGSIIGAVLVRRTIAVDYPLNNAYINREGLAQQMTRQIGLEVQFSFGPVGEAAKDGRYASTVLYGIDSVQVGTVSVQRPARSAYIETQNAKYQTIEALLAALLVVGLALAAARRLGVVRPRWLRLAAAVVLIWLGRFSLLWLDVPSSIVAAGVFDPAMFASKFGGGLARSIGEMTISVLVLLLSTILILRGAAARNVADDFRRAPFGRILRIVLVIAGALLGYWLLRGYAAVVRSAVYDSTLRFADTRVIIPDPVLAIMLLNLFIIGWCLLALVISGAGLALRLLSGKPPGTIRFSHGVWAALLVTASALLFSRLPGEPLVSDGYRIAFGIGTVVLAFLLFGKMPTSLLRTRNLFILLACSAALLYPLLNVCVDGKDRERVETFAGEVLRPVDSWFSTVVDDALSGFATEETAAALERKDPDELSRLAFSHWAASSACREGYTSAFSVWDTYGNELSRFSIGGESVRAAAVDTIDEPPKQRALRVRTLGSGINAVKVYTGSVPIRESGGALLGYGRVMVAAGQQTLFRGDNPSIFRGSGTESIEGYYRPITLSEFRDGILLTTTSATLPIGYTLPDLVRAQFEQQPAIPVWVNESVNGQDYETFYVSRERGPVDVMSLSLPAQGFDWHFINIVKMLFFYAMLCVIVLAGGLTVRVWRGEEIIGTFRDRLLTALLVVALIPLGLIAIYGRYTARQRVMERTSRQLDDETSTLQNYLLEQISTNTGGIRSSFTPALAEQIASDLGIDFNLYVGNALRLTSRPELYEAGILDRRLGGSAYASIMVRGERFLAETESIGQIRYAVGYRPLQDASGGILGIVSVPTLYRQDQIEEETARRNAFLFGAYAFILIAVIIIATTLANRIAAPIHLLTDATRRVSRGDLDVTVRAVRADGEVGELIRSFDTMISDLKRSREELIRYERELAWKEMAQQVAHEIKNPLTPMRLAIQHLRQVYRDKVPDLDQIMDDVTATIIGQIDTLSRIASEFSHFARMPKPSIEPSDVNAVLRESIGLFERPGAIEVRASLADDLPPVAADREGLQRVFINVFRNAVQAMNDAGRIDVQSGRTPTGVEVRIRDYGLGMPPEVRAKLFQPNFSTKSEGMGLGLSIVKQTLDGFGGTITIDSGPRDGTLVIIRLSAFPGGGEPA